MTSRANARFWKAFSELSPELQRQAREAYRLFRDNPKHPSLRFKKVHPERPIYAARVSRNYRALGVLAGDEIIWFWVGAHSDYARLLKSL